MSTSSSESKFSDALKSLLHSPKTQVLLANPKEVFISYHEIILKNLSLASDKQPNDEKYGENITQINVVWAVLFIYLFMNATDMNNFC